MQEDKNQKPYLEKFIIELEYNPLYGDMRICQCGHYYYRHFDSYDFMRNIGCKYCGCRYFKERIDYEI